MYSKNSFSGFGRTQESSKSNLILAPLKCCQVLLVSKRKDWMKILADALLLQKSYCIQAKVECLTKNSNSFFLFDENNLCTTNSIFNYYFQICIFYISYEFFNWRLDNWVSIQRNMWRSLLENSAILPYQLSLPLLVFLSK